ncbi:hypothetical protein SpiGrapes_0618 [Sphaerochaeta pleomorpha str. Grapes]|uniref:Uncharacterized protein n=1 Tax=Sphaerochaeta pleomorpha (strain ATCC BAA-1885 / DSM 22778 / Grapes) TaxID=158190 RepID=G8QXF9_SPHPG|nr:hypothetical protein [Sphaerochaeta pleomorpha]AEV28460.1 hypothetical protein SpiGrapes_0618 [Sphaerochaeta pleomorpha str. Grapes]
MKAKSRITFLLILAGIVTSVFASGDIALADSLYDSEQFEQCKSELVSQLQGETESLQQAQILWRLSRVQVALGDDLDKEDKAKRFEAYELGEEYANQSIEKQPLPLAFLWRSSNLGRWGQTKGPLNSLSKAKGMLADLTQVVNTFNTLDSSETWYVLSSLYDELPGGPISFGNGIWAVSYMRKALDTIPSNLLYPGHYKKLAEELYSRNWDSSKRKKEIIKMQANWEKDATNLEKFRYYEGKDGKAGKPFYSSVTLEKMSDRQEAVMILRYALAKYKVFSTPKTSDEKDIREITALLGEWT